MWKLVEDRKSVSKRELSDLTSMSGLGAKSESSGYLRSDGPE